MSRPTSLAKAQATIDAAFIPERLETAAIQALEDALGATVMVRGTVRGPDGRCEYVQVPDHAIRVVAAVRLLEFRRGKPSSSLTLNAPSVRGGSAAQSLSDLRQKNPELFQRILSAYADAAKPAVRVEEVEATPNAQRD